LFSLSPLLFSHQYFFFLLLSDRYWAAIPFSPVASFAPCFELKEDGKKAKYKKESGREEKERENNRSNKEIKGLTVLIKEKDVQRGE